MYRSNAFQYLQDEPTTCGILNRMMEEGARLSAFRVHKLSIGNISSNCVVVVVDFIVEKWRLGPLEKGFTSKR